MLVTVRSNGIVAAVDYCCKEVDHGSRPPSDPVISPLSDPVISDIVDDVVGQRSEKGRLRDR